MSRCPSASHCPQEGGQIRKVSLVPTADGVLSRQDGPVIPVALNQRPALRYPHNGWTHVMIQDGFTCIRASRFAAFFPPSAPANIVSLFDDWASGDGCGGRHSDCEKHRDALFRQYGSFKIVCR